MKKDIQFRTRTGTVMLEFVLAFPLVLTLILACMQFSHIWIAKQVVHYSAYCAARAAIVYHDDEREDAAGNAAKIVCAWILRGARQNEQNLSLPGWGDIPGSAGINRKVRVNVTDVGLWNVKAEVQADFALIFPLVGPMIGWGMNPWDSGREYEEQRSDDVNSPDLVRYPHITFRENVVLPRPYVVVPQMGVPNL